MTLAVIGSIVVAGGLALSALEEVDDGIFYIRIGDCGASDGSRVRFVPCSDPAANTHIVSWRRWDQSTRGSLIGAYCPSGTTAFKFEPQACWATP